MTEKTAQEPLYLGLEFGSTRIKSVLVNRAGSPVAVGAFTWENQQRDGYWSYDREDAIRGMQQSFAALKQQYLQQTGLRLTRLAGIGLSGMMHGYIAADEAGSWLVPFRTWRNTTATPAAARLSAALGWYIPPRWSVAHLYQAALDGEAHLVGVTQLFTLSGYMHWLLTGVRAVGLCEGSGMFPVKDGAYRQDCMEIFRRLYREAGQTADPAGFFPPLLAAGCPAGVLTPAGAALLDPSGELEPGAPFCPPEGDAATGMVATNSVLPGTANVSAGTSAFLMAVLPGERGDTARDMDHIVTPDGAPVVMIHENNCTGGINAWVELFGEVARMTGGSEEDLFSKLFRVTQQADCQLGGLTCYPYYAAEPAVGVSEGYLRLCGNAESRLTLANFMKTQLCSAIAPIAYRVRALYRQGVVLHRVAGHGGFFKTPQVGAALMSAALHCPVSTTHAAGEGGAYGMALLALYLAERQTSLPAFLEEIFSRTDTETVTATEQEQRCFEEYLARYLAPLPCSRGAAEE